MDNIKNILDSQAGLIIKGCDYDDREVVDNRFILLKQSIDLVENKDISFYEELVSILSDYLNKLYDIEINDFPRVVLDEKGERISQDYDKLISSDISKLRESNRDLSENLFEYVCEILNKHKDVKLSVETLTKLLNRNPKLFSLSIERSYLYRNLDFKKLVKIINENQTLTKSNISVDELYQLLINTSQIDVSEIFTGLITKEQFNDNHEKISEFLSKCNSKYFADVTKIITRNYDKEFDRLNIVKKRKESNFTERLIIQLLKSNLREEDYIFIHNLLTDKNANIDYEYDYADYFGQTSLKELIAFSGNKIIIKDLLNKEENIKNTYWYGESKIQLYRLYAIVGDYEKALENFQENYNYAYDFTGDYYKGFNQEGYASGDITYSDSLVEFIGSICKSFENEKIEYITRKNIINRILNSENVKYINLDETLPIFQETLSEEDFKILLDSIIEKHNSGGLGFIVVEEQDELYSRYAIRIASDEQMIETLASFNKKKDTKILNLKKDIKRKDD